MKILPTLVEHLEFFPEIPMSNELLQQEPVRVSIRVEDMKSVC
jgi:hypothetical protein